MICTSSPDAASLPTGFVSPPATTPPPLRCSSHFSGAVWVVLTVASFGKLGQVTGLVDQHVGDRRLFGRDLLGLLELRVVEVNVVEADGVRRRGVAGHRAAEVEGQLRRRVFVGLHREGAHERLRVRRQIDGVGPVLLVGRAGHADLRLHLHRLRGVGHVRQRVGVALADHHLAVARLGVPRVHAFVGDGDAELAVLDGGGARARRRERRRPRDVLAAFEGVVLQKLVPRQRRDVHARASRWWARRSSPSSTVRGSRLRAESPGRRRRAPWPAWWRRRRIGPRGAVQADNASATKGNSARERDPRKEATESSIGRTSGGRPASCRRRETLPRNPVARKARRRMRSVVARPFTSARCRRPGRR